MFVATVINFLLASLNTGNYVAGLIVFIRKSLMITLDLNYSLLEEPELANDALRNGNIIASWAEALPVSIKLLIPDLISIHTR